MKNIISIIIATCLCCCLGLALVGCGEPAVGPTETVDQALTALKAGDSEALQSLCAEGTQFGTEVVCTNLQDMIYAQISDDQQATIDDYCAKVQDFDYTLGEETVDEGSATVQVTLTTYDFAPMTKPWLQQYGEQALNIYSSTTDDAAIDQQLSAALADTLAGHIGSLGDKSLSSTVTIPLELVDDVWMISDIDQDTADAFTGGALYAFGFQAFMEE